nr:MAG TPA: hypothetical protein [Crassvirales sp.]
MGAKLKLLSQLCKIITIFLMNGLIFLLTSLCYHRVPTIAYLNILSSQIVY